MERVVFVVIVSVGLATLLSAEKPMINGKPDFSGAWQAEASGTARWTIEQRPDGIAIREVSLSGKPITEVRCGVDGKECSGRVDGGDAATVFYFNGPMLVQMTTRKDKVTKTRRTLSPDGQRITMEVIPINPPGDTEKVVLVRAGDSSAQTSTAAAQ